MVLNGGVCWWDWSWVVSSGVDGVFGCVYSMVMVA